MRRRRPWAR
uniref:Uncharacterized protein n=1 Tax=Arundo donax TaxID=35708 RepID=A0A0A9ERG4_ARUDO